MKNLGLLIALVGILVVASALAFTPSFSFNPVDSTNGVKSAAPLFFSGLIVFGAGVVIYANAVAPKKKQAN